jgi:hypothetical protein
VLLIVSQYKEKGHNPDKCAGDLARIWEAIDQEDSSMIHLLHQVVDTVSVIISESRVHREESVVGSCKADGLPVTLDAMGEKEPMRQGGREADSHPR